MTIDRVRDSIKDIKSELSWVTKEVKNLTADNYGEVNADQVLSYIEDVESKIDDALSEVDELDSKFKELID